MTTRVADRVVLDTLATINVDDFVFDRNGSLVARWGASTVSRGARPHHLVFGGRGHLPSGGVRRAAGKALPTGKIVMMFVNICAVDNVTGSGRLGRAARAAHGDVTD